MIYWLVAGNISQKMICIKSRSRISVQELKRQMKNKAGLFRVVLLITVLAGALRIYATKELFGYGDEPTYMKVAVNYANILRSGHYDMLASFDQTTNIPSSIRSYMVRPFSPGRPSIISLRNSCTSVNLLPRLMWRRG